MSSISYAIVVWNEHKELDRLLTQLKQFIRSEDEIVIQADSKVTQEVIKVIYKHGLPLNIYGLNNDFATFKNHLKSLCTKEYIFQIDADELLSVDFLRDVHILISDETIDAFVIPRINILVDKSELEEYINECKWTTNRESWLAYPDGQTRLIKNKSGVYWEKPIHEYLIGLKTIVNLSNEYNIIHIKSTQRQDIQNNFYKNTFSAHLL
jgi:hypothetical protein